MYTDLLEMERKLDWQMMRKKAEIQDTLGRPPTVCHSPMRSPVSLTRYYQATRTLRLFLSHTVANQSWQTGAPSGFDGTNVNLETGEGIPAWQLKIEGRLLEVHRFRTPLCITY
jgi:SWI/SNF-related matrix-associated actin-dependent regulator of chromatin subfamily D